MASATPPATSTNESPLLLLAGPTAAGKSEIALCLAERLNGEIVSVDSMQVYRGLDIGTAKPSPVERARVTHHLIDVCDLAETFDAACFVRLAQAAVAQIRSRGRLPILCGGTGLYFKALLEGLGDSPPADPVLRKQLERLPLPDLLTELEKGDPETHRKIDRQNPRRVIRAVEVIRLTGRPFSEQRARWRGCAPFASPRSVMGFGISRGVAELNGRIERRVEVMFANGLVGETEELLKRGLLENQTASQAIGYRQVIEYLRGLRPLPQTVELVKIRTRQFAKRQRTWFRHQLPLTWVPVAPGQTACAVGAAIEQEYKNGLK